MSLLPRIYIYGVCVAGPDGEFEGRTIEISWLGWLFQVSLLRRDRLVEGGDGDAR